jgi:hypothetical protein
MICGKAPRIIKCISFRVPFTGFAVIYFKDTLSLVLLSARHVRIEDYRLLPHLSIFYFYKA